TLGELATLAAGLTGEVDAVGDHVTAGGVCGHGIPATGRDADRDVTRHGAGLHTCVTLEQIEGDVAADRIEFDRVEAAAVDGHLSAHGVRLELPDEAVPLDAAADRIEVARPFEVVDRHVAADRVGPEVGPQSA